MSSDISEFYETVVIKEKIWFVCKYSDCQDCELEEQDIISHIRQQHLSPHNHRSDEQITAHNSDQDIWQPMDVDIKPKIEIIPLQTTASDETEELHLNDIQTPHLFRCHVSGCGKTFLYLKTLLEHRNNHKTKKQMISKNVAKSQIRPQMKGQTKPTANHNYSNIKEKYLRVQRLNDRSIHRWQKQDHRSDANYAGMQSLKNLGQYYTKDIIDGQKKYLCGYNQSCQFRTNRSQHMARHLNCCHLRTRIFRCTKIGCGRQYYNPTSLRQHSLNHICGFGILNGKTMKTLCGNNSINRYRRRIIENDIKLYKCGFLDCPFKTKSHTCIKRHIHDQHLCPNRVRYLDKEILSEIMPTEQSSQQNCTKPQNNVKTGCIEIPEMIAIVDIRRHSPVKRRTQNTCEVIPIMQELPKITDIPEMVTQIPVTPELIDLRDVPTVKRQINREVRQYGNIKDVHQVINQLIDDENNANKCTKHTNLTNDDNNGSDEEIQILDEIIVKKRTSPDFQRLTQMKSIKIDYNINNYNQCWDELSKLNRCRPHFDVSNEHKRGIRFVCKCCQFPAKSLEGISMHLRIKHFIDN